MKTVALLLILLFAANARAEDVLLGDTKATHQQERYVWSVPADRITKLPSWKKGEAPPLSMQRAEEIGYVWTRRQRLRGLLPERPFIISVVQFPQPFGDRYFYKVHFEPEGRDSFWTVHILMDGSIVEPKSIQPNLK